MPMHMVFDKSKGLGMIVGIRMQFEPNEIELLTNACFGGITLYVVALENSFPLEVESIDESIFAFEMIVERSNRNVRIFGNRRNRDAMVPGHSKVG